VIVTYNARVAECSGNFPWVSNIDPNAGRIMLRGLFFVGARAGFFQTV